MPSVGESSVVVCDQLRTVDKTRLTQIAGKLSRDDLRAVEDACARSCNCDATGPPELATCGRWRAHAAALSAAEPAHMILQPAARGIECVANGDVQVLVRVVLARLPVDHDLAARQREIDAHVKDLALTMASVGSLQRHPAGGHAIRDLLELLRSAPHLGLDGWRRLHAAERNLDVCRHKFLLT